MVGCGPSKISKTTYSLQSTFNSWENDTRDQGWQYQQKWFQDFLIEHGMVQSMSRKGNCHDNSPTENFFGRLKEEVFYGQEWRYESIEELRQAIHCYIKYYNEERIVLRLKTSPHKYKLQLGLRSNI